MQVAHKKDKLRRGPSKWFGHVIDFQMHLFCKSKKKMHLFIGAIMITEMCQKGEVNVDSHGEKLSKNLTIFHTSSISFCFLVWLFD